MTREWNVQLPKPLYLHQSGYPYCIIDNWYNEEEERKVWTELEYYKSFKDPERAESSEYVGLNNNNEPLSHAYRYYPNNPRCPILSYIDKVRTDTFHNILASCLPYYRHFSTSNADSTIISYYEDNDHYKDHHDMASWTQLIWFVREPHAFTGGDLTLSDIQTTIPLTHNRAVFFPSCYMHSSTPLQGSTEGYGKWTITHLYYSHNK